LFVLPIFRISRDGQSAHRLFTLASILIFVTGCASTPKQVPTHTQQAWKNPVVSYALGLKGTPYSWGGESRYEGFDCSGFVQHVYGRHGVRLPRTARQMAAALPPIPNPNRQPGDLVFFNTTGAPYSHVGIYIGHDDFVHSSSAKGKVIVSSLVKPYWKRHFLGIRRPDQLDHWLRFAEK
jgi:cell wall-associated NlpC family hydrolase